MHICLGQAFCFLLLFSKDALIWSKVTVNVFIMFLFLINAFYSSKKYIMVSTKILSSTTDFNIDRNVSWAANLHIIMISEGSCETEDDAENSALHHRNKLYFKTYWKHIKYFIIVHVLLYFWSYKCSPGEHKWPLSKTSKSYQPQTFDQ